MIMKSTKDAGAILAQELNQLTLKEREELLYDIHGVLELPKEEPDFVASCLQQMDKEISTYSHNDKKAYELAHAQNYEYVSSERLRLKFLRADNFNPRLAAQRLIKFFASKLQLFGPEYLTRDIRLDDLMSEDDNNCIESGLLQLLPLRDRAGRAVICWMAAVPGSELTRVSPSYIDHLFVTVNNYLILHIFFYLLSSKMRALFYGCMCASEDEETQQRGLAFVVIPAHIGCIQSRLESARNLAPLLSALPVRPVALHFCIEARTSFAPIFDAAVAAVGKQIRVRVRAHHGTCCLLEEINNTPIACYLCMRPL
jgi:hypothetical protein